MQADTTVNTSPRSFPLWILLATVIPLLAFPSRAADTIGTNLVQDGGFEQGGAGWVFSVNIANASGGVVADEAHGGQKSFRISNSSGYGPNVFGRVTQIIRGLEPYTTYRISCFAKGTNAGIVWIGGGPGWYLRARFPAGTFGWTNITTEYTTGEATPDFELIVATEDVTSAVWVDDVRMEAVRADTAKRDAAMNQAKSLWQASHDRLDALSARAQTNVNARNDAVTQLGFNVADRYLKRTENAGVGARQGGGWTRLQLEEVPVVLDATEQRLAALEKSTTPAKPQPWPTVSPAQVRDGLFHAKMQGGGEQPFWFYGYGHFNQVIADLPNFRGLGASLIQDATVGPSSMNEDGSLSDGAKQMVNDLKTAQKDGMRMDWLLSPHYFPGWAFAKAPDIHGGGPGFIAFDIDHPVARDVLGKFAVAMSKELKAEPALLTVDLSNEPVYAQSGRTKYGQPEYDEYLKKIHGSIEKLNGLYGTHYTNFAEIAPPPIGLKGTDNENRAYYDWVRFNQKHFADWHAWLGSKVKENLPNTPTHAKIMVFFCLDRDKLHYGVDPEMFCDATDIAGCDAYAFAEGDKKYNWIGQEFYYDLLYSFRHQPVFNSENHVVPDGFPPNHIAWEATRAAIWQGGLHHQGATTTWVWEEAVDMSLSGSIYFRPANTYGQGRAMLELNRFAAEAAAIDQLKPRVALLYSQPSIFWEEAYRATILSSYRQLNYLGEPVDFISEKELAEGRMPKNEWIIATAATHVSDATTKALRRFVASGGHLAVAGTNNFAWDEYNRPRAAAEIPAATALPQLKEEKHTAAALAKVLAGSGVDLGHVAEADTSEAAWGVEFRRAKVGRKLVFAIIEMGGRTNVVKIPELHGKEVVDVLTGETADPDKISLEPMTPQLLETK